MARSRSELPLTRQLLRVHPYGPREVQRGLHDAALLLRVRGRVALGRRGALGPADVAELQLARQDLHEARGHVRAGAHVARLLLQPDDFSEVRVAGDELEDLALRERIQQLDAADRDALVVRALLRADEVVVDLARAE